MVGSTLLVLTVTAGLRASGWALPVRAILVVLPAVFWAATIAAAIAGLAPRRAPGPAGLAALGAATLAFAECSALGPS
jgi:hypothetical protein